MAVSPKSLIELTKDLNTEKRSNQISKRLLSYNFEYDYSRYLNVLSWYYLVVLDWTISYSNLAKVD